MGRFMRVCSKWNMRTYASYFFLKINHPDIKFFHEPEIIYYKKSQKSVLNTKTFFLQETENK